MAWQAALFHLPAHLIARSRRRWQTTFGKWKRPDEWNNSEDDGLTGAAGVSTVIGQPGTTAFAVGGSAAWSQRCPKQASPTARPVGQIERVVKWARRRPVAAGLVATTVLLLLALVAGVVGLFSYGAVQAQRDRAESALDEAQTQKTIAENARTEEEKQRRIADAEGEKARKAEKKAQDSLKLTERVLANSKVTLAEANYREGQIALARDRLDEVPEEFRRWEWRYLKRKAAGGLFTLYGHNYGVSSICFSPDGHAVLNVCFSADGQRLATGSNDKTVKVWDARTGQQLLDLQGHTNWVSSVHFSTDGQRLVSTDGGGKTLVWDARTGKPVDRAPPPLVPASDRSPDGRFFAWLDGVVVRLIGPPDAEELLVRHARTRLDLSWHSEEAARLEKELQWPAAAFHLEQVLSARPDAVLDRHRLLRALAETVRLQPEQSSAWRRLALAQLQAGQQAAYRRTCLQMQQHFRVPGPVPRAVFALGAMPSHPAGAALTTALLQHPAAPAGAGDFDRLQTVRASVLRPDTLTEPESWLPLLPKEAKLDGWSSMFRRLEPLTLMPKETKLLRGAVLYRAGKHAEAVKELQVLHEPVACLFRALAEHGRGDRENARQALDEARKQLPPEKIDLDQQTPLPWHQRVESGVLLKVVEALLAAPK
jgi:hypothetical protein